MVLCEKDKKVSRVSLDCRDPSTHALLSTSVPKMTLYSHSYTTRFSGGSLGTRLDDPGYAYHVIKFSR